MIRSPLDCGASIPPTHIVQCSAQLTRAPTNPLHSELNAPGKRDDGHAEVMRICEESVAARRTVPGPGFVVESISFLACAMVTLRGCADRFLLIANEEERGKVAFIKAGRELREEYGLQTGRITLLHVDASLFPLITESPLAEQRRTFWMDDPMTWSMMVRLGELAASDTLHSDRRYFEALAAVLLHGLAWSSPTLRSVSEFRGGLAGWQRRLVKAYIEEHYADHIPLATLAAMVRLSKFHFCRAFKTTFGASPQRYQNRLRIERAKQLLASGEITMTDVGLEVGFGSASSFASAFRKATGLSPSRYSQTL